MCHSQVPDIHGKAILASARREVNEIGSNETLAIKKRGKVLEVS